MIIDHDDEGRPIHETVSEGKAVNGRVRLLARETGYVGNRLIAPGQSFDMPLTCMKIVSDPDVPPAEIARGGRWFQVPRWATRDCPEEHEALARDTADERENFVAAAVASSGSGHGGGVGKKKSFVEFVMAGGKKPSELPPSAQAAWVASGSAHGAEAKMTALRAAATQADLPVVEDPE